MATRSYFLLSVLYLTQATNWLPLKKVSSLPPPNKQRLTELETKKARLEQAITVESAREKNMITKEDIERYITDAIKLSSKQMVELLVERIDVYADKLCIRLKYSDSPIELPANYSIDFSYAAPTGQTDFYDTAGNNADPLRNALQATQTDTPPEIANTDDRPDRYNFCRGGRLFSFSKSHEITQTRIYKSGRTHVFISTTTFMIEPYI